MWAYGGLGNREWRKLHNEELNNLYCTHDILWVIKSRRMRWAGHVVCMEEGRGVYRGDSGVGEITILKWILWKWGMGLLTGSSWLRIGAGVEHL